MLKRLILALAPALLFLPAAKAQIGLYGTFSGAKIGASDWIYGSNFGAYSDSHHFPIVNFGLDARGTILSKDNTHLYAGSFGPRAVVHIPAIPLRPYVEGLVGVASVKANNSDGTHLSYSAIGGLDTTILPRIDWRVVEFTYGGFTGVPNGTNQKTLSTGLVFRIPFL